MKTKREAAIRRGSDRRSKRDGSARNSGGATTEPTPARRARTRAGKNSAPSREARGLKSGPQTSPIARPVARPARPKTASQAKARAKARKAKAPKAIRPKLTERLAARLSQVDLRPRALLTKVPFVVLVIGSLGVGLGLTLWLSTDSAERSYQLSHARERTRMLQQQKESLERDVRQAESAPALAEAARKQGMIPTTDTAHLVQDPDGNWVVVGTPKPADGIGPPPLNTKLPDAGPPPPKPSVIPPEVPVWVTPGPSVPPPPAPPGSETLLRGPDEGATLGGQHLPQSVPRLPGLSGGQVAGAAPGLLPMPGLPIAQIPAEVPVPLGAAPVPVPAQQPVPGPVEVPVPLQQGLAPVAPRFVNPTAPLAPVPSSAPQLAAPAAPIPQVLTPGLQPVVTPPVPALVPATGEQFGPVTATPPGAQR